MKRTFLGLAFTFIYILVFPQTNLEQGLVAYYPADGNADGLIDNLDLENVWAPQAGEAGYKSGDFNMDTEVDNKDKDDVWCRMMVRDRRYRNKFNNI